MNVLEFGCGVGEVTLIAARLVGPQGTVHSLDIDGNALEIARERIQSAGHDHVSFEQIDIHAHRPARLYDAVIGRHILIHTPDPLDILKTAASLVHVGGVVAFQEYDLSRRTPGYPATPLATAVFQCLCDFIVRVRPAPDVGVRLPHLLVQAGLTTPDAHAECVIGSGRHSLFFEWFAETYRTLLPAMQSLGMQLPDVPIEELESRMRDEALAVDAFISGPLMVGAFARKPADHTL